MSVNDIIDYVNKTPGNTNPAVIKSMVELENYGVLEKAQQMDEETLAMAKAYTDSQRLAYTELERGAISWDGNIDGRAKFPLEYLGSGGFLYHISSTFLRPSDIYQLTVFNPGTGVHSSVKITEFVVEPGVTIVYGEYMSAIGSTSGILALSVNGAVDDLPPGTYVFHRDIDYIENIYGTVIETIHTIDPKYIPWNSAPGGGSSGGGIPIVELTTMGDQAGVPVSDEENAKLNEATANGVPFFVKLPISDGLIAPTTIAFYENEVAGVIAILPSMLGMDFSWAKRDDGWYAALNIH